jgi:putative ABC transport system permease protein
MMLFKLAYRNLWRNKRTTFITIASVFFAVFFAVILRSMQIGVYEKMIENVVGYYSGYIQIHKNGYWKEQTIDECHPLFGFAGCEFEGVKRRCSTVLPRLEGFVLAATQELTKGALVNGIDPNEKAPCFNLEEKMVSGKVFPRRSKRHSRFWSSGLLSKLGVPAIRL